MEKPRRLTRSSIWDVREGNWYAQAEARGLFLGEMGFCSGNVAEAAAVQDEHGRDLGGVARI